MSEGQHEGRGERRGDEDEKAHLAEISWMKLRMGLRAWPVRSSTRVAVKLSAEAQGEAYES
jgi:hypothetical protein